jgi:hypothetical protein
MRLMKHWQARIGDTLELPTENRQPPGIDLMGQQRKPDQWQPDWIVKSVSETLSEKKDAFLFCDLPVAARCWKCFIDDALRLGAGACIRAKRR